MAEQPSVLGRVVELNHAAIVAARDLLEKTKLVRLLGLGSSRHAAGYGAVALEVIGGIPTTVLPAPGTEVALPAFRQGEVVIALSQSGRTPALVQAAAEARAQGVPVIAVTNEPDSPLTNGATVALDCAAGPERVVAATKSVTAQALLLRAIADPLSAGSIEGLVEGAEWTLDEMDVSPALGGKHPEIVICSGFGAEWIADEIALKFAEVAGRLVAAEPLVEYLHGPAAAPASALVFIEADDPNLEALLSAADTVTVGTHPNFDVRIPSTGDASLDPILRLIAGQKIVLEWALRLGEDPDADRGLTKVTSTR